MEMESAFDMLAEDPSGQGLKRLREELFEMRMDVKRAMDAGTWGNPSFFSPRKNWGPTL